MNECIPIILFVYNREKELKLLIESIKENVLTSDSRLFIFSEAPKSNNQIDEEKVKVVRRIIKKINGFKSVNIFESNEHKGLSVSVISGVTKVLKEYGRAIVLEDDLVLSSNYLEYMNQALSYYENDNNIISVSGYTLPLKSINKNKDYYFGYRASSWGWGCWWDQWKNIDWSLSDYSEILKKRSEQRKFNKGGSDLTRMLKNQQSGKIDSWAIRFCFHQYKNNLKTVFPTVSKVVSTGFSKDATNTVGATRFKTLLDLGEKKTFQFDPYQKIDEQLMKEFKNYYSTYQRIINKIKISK